MWIYGNPEVSELSARQLMFVKEYLVDLNATQAAIRAGYSAKTADAAASRLLRKVSIATAVQEGMDRRASRIEVTADYVLETIVSTIERCKQSEPVVDKAGNTVLTETNDGNVVPAYTFNAIGVLKGAELLGKHLKLFTEKHEHSGAVSLVVSAEDAEL
jgi:phage terminase small subunit